MTRVTVGIPTYRRAGHLKEAIKLVLSQTFSDFELVICDDASPDNTAEVVASFQDSRIHYHRNPENLNIPGNLNQILSLAKGEYIAILHDHDIFDRRLLELMVAMLDAHPSIGFVHPGVAWVDSDGHTNYKVLVGDFPEVMPGEELVRSMLESDSFSCPVCACGMVRRDAYNKVGVTYDKRFGFLSDVDMWFRLAMAYDIGYLRTPLITCRRRDEDHPFNGINWQLVQWATEIQRVNVERFSAKYPRERARFLEIWSRKRTRYYVLSLLGAAGSGNLVSFREGLRVIGGTNGGEVGWLARFLEKIPTLHSTLLMWTRIGNAARKRLKAINVNR